MQTIATDPALLQRQHPSAPSARGGSIWAPQPQPSDVTWPKTMDTFSRGMDGPPQIGSAGPRQQVITREDVFGPNENNRGSPGSIPSKEVGAIGDGRKKTSNYEDTHVEQLLRTLDLNSPDTYARTAQKPSLELNMSTDSSARGSPEYSPLSTGSALLTPADLSPPRTFDMKPQLQLPSQYDPYVRAPNGHASQHSPLMFDPDSPTRSAHIVDSISHSPSYTALLPQSLTHTTSPRFGSRYDSSSLAQSASATSLSALAPPNLGQYQTPADILNTTSLYQSPAQPLHSRIDSSLSALHRLPGADAFSRAASHWDIPANTVQPPVESQLPRQQADWLRPGLEANPMGLGLGMPMNTGAVDDLALASARSTGSFYPSPTQQTFQHRQRSISSSPPGGAHEPINFLSLLHPSSSPPYHAFVSRIIKTSDQQASIFLQQKLKVADFNERAKIVDAICARGFDMMAHRFGNWAVQRCLEAASTPEERRKIVSCMRGRIVDLATNCYGCHVLQKALDCEEDIRLMIVSELLRGDPAQTLVNKHASHVWSKIMELSWTPPAPPIFQYVNKSLKGKWAGLACHETGSLVVQHAFENLEDSAKDDIVDELLGQGANVFSDVAKNQWGSYCIQHILEHGSEQHRQLTLDHLISGLLDYATNEQGFKSLTKALKEGGKEILDRVVKRMCEPARGARRAMIVDLALSVTGSQLIAAALPMADKDQRALLYDCIKGHIVTLRGCKTGSKVIWLFDRMRAYYGY